jgi:hypothetical protein
MTLPSRKDLWFCAGATILIGLGVSIWYFYVPIEERICPATASAALVITVEPSMTQRQLDAIAHRVGVGIIGFSPFGLTSLTPINPNAPVINTTWLVEVPCFKDGPRGEHGPPPAVQRVEANLLATPGVLNVYDPETQPEWQGGPM